MQQQDDWEVDELPSRPANDASEGLDWEVDQPQPPELQSPRTECCSIQQEVADGFSQLVSQLSSSSEDEADDSSSDFDSESDADAAAAAAGRPKTSSREQKAYEFFRCALHQELGKLYCDKKKKKRRSSTLRCIACAATGRRWKAYPSATGLVQHARSIRKTRHRAEHHAYARAISDFMS